MEAFLSTQFSFAECGLVLHNSGKNDIIYTWDELKESYFEKKHYFAPVGSSIEWKVLFFYWIDLHPNGKKDEFFRIHFPKGEDECDEFQRLYTYYILKSQNLLGSYGRNDTTYKVLEKLFHIK